MSVVGQDGNLEMIGKRENMEPKELELDDAYWSCHLFGSDPRTGNGIVYKPVEGRVPNWFVRWMMKICLGCTWISDKEGEHGN